MMLIAWGLVFLTLSNGLFAAVPKVEPEFLAMLRETGQHELFAKFLGINDVSLVLPTEGRTEEELIFTNVSPLGDILLTQEQEEQARQGINFARLSSYKWPNNTIPYVIQEEDFNDEEIAKIKSATDEFNKRSKNLKIVPRTNQDDYVLIFRGKGCYSNLGKAGGQQPLSLESDYCLRIGTVIHEFLHAAGFMHEHCRPDRDNYVEVLWVNIPEEWHPQYEKMSSEYFGIQGNYDYYSVMHYPVSSPTGKQAFNIKDPSIDQRYIGQRIEPTPTDMEKVNKLYS